MMDWLADNWLALGGLVVAGLGVAIALRSLSVANSVRGLAHAALVEAQIGVLVRQDEYGRPTREVLIDNTGPGIALGVEVEVTETFEGPPDPNHPGWWIRPSRTPVIDRLGATKSVTVRVPASGDDSAVDRIIVRWTDGAGEQQARPQPRRLPQIF